MRHCSLLIFRSNFCNDDKIAPISNMKWVLLHCPNNCLGLGLFTQKFWQLSLLFLWVLGLFKLPEMTGITATAFCVWSQISFTSISCLYSRRLLGLFPQLFLKKLPTIYSQLLKRMTKERWRKFETPSVGTIPKKLCSMPFRYFSFDFRNVYIILKLGS